MTRDSLVWKSTKMANVVLIPGLKVDVDGTSDEQGQFVAKTITVDGDDLETSEMIQAGLNPTAEQVAANMEAIEANRGQIAAHKAQIAALKEDSETNQQNSANHEQKIEQNLKVIEETTNRFISLADYDVKGEATVKFAVGSSSISTEDQEALKNAGDKPPLA